MKHKIAILISSVLLLTAMISGCAVSPSVLTPLSSTYPADIIGRVTIADTVLALNFKGVKEESLASTVALQPNRVWWIVQVSVNNKEYQEPVSPGSNSWNGVWAVIYNGNFYSGTMFVDTQQAGIPKGQTGQLWISFMGEKGFDLTQVQLCYQGEKPYSYGKLIKGDTVAVFDWELKKETHAQVTQTQTTQTQSQKNMATTESISVIMWLGYEIQVEVKPTSSVIANKIYKADLYEKGKLRAQTTVSWNQPEVNVSAIKPIYFPASVDEYNAYLFKDISHIFSVKVHE